MTVSESATLQGSTGEGPKQKPSVGRIVIYRFPVALRDMNNHGEIAPAVIVQVWTDACVNLKILNDGPENSWRTSVVLGEGDGEWSWPTRV